MQKVKFAVPEAFRNKAVSRPANALRSAANRVISATVWFAVLGMTGSSYLRAASIFDFAPNGFTLTNNNADGFVTPIPNGFVLTGGNNGSGNPGTTDYTAMSTGTGNVQFNWSYSSLDLPTLDYAGYLVNNNFFSLADTDGESGIGMFSVSAGQSFGFRVGTADNQGEPGVLTVTSTVPEPGTGVALLVVATVCLTVRRRQLSQAVGRNL